MRKTALVTGAVLVLSLALVAIATGAARDTYKVSTKLTPGADVPKPKGASGASGSWLSRLLPQITARRPAHTVVTCERPIDLCCIDA